MKQKTIIVILSIALVLSIGGGIAVYAASTLGSRDDPLITRSYLTDRFSPDLLKTLEDEMDAKIAEAEGRINKTISENGSTTANSYVLVTLTAGQKLRGFEGTELLLRSGAGTCAATGGMLDLSSGEMLANGSALAANHLYLLSAEGDCFAATSGATLLVRGTYSIA